MTEEELKIVCLQLAIEVSDRKWYTEDVVFTATKFYEYVRKV
jgi:hypothetical protein